MKNTTLSRSKDKRRSTSPVNRKIELGDEGAQVIRNPLLDLTRTELLAHIAALQNQNGSLHAELSRQHERANQATRMVGKVYQFLLGLPHAYIQAREATEQKPIPAFWIAARCCDVFEDMFERYDIEAFDLGPQRDLLTYLYKLANRPLNRGSKVGSYCIVDVNPPEPPQGEGNVAAGEGQNTVEG